MQRTVQLLVLARSVINLFETFVNSAPGRFYASAQLARIGFAQSRAIECLPI